LLDTGASTTYIDETAAAKLGLPVIDKVNMASVSHEATLSNVYPALIQFLGFPIKVNATRTVGSPLANQGLIVLFGRDLLQNFALFYNGITGQITISV